MFEDFVGFNLGGRALLLDKMEEGLDGCADVS
jgi:hypothetical protein